jgi:LPS-assembly lipoprotein
MFMLMAVLSVVLLLLLTGCGFALKGTSKPLPFTVLGVQAPNNSPLFTPLVSALAAKGVRVVSVTDPLAAPLPRLTLSNEVHAKTVLSTTVQGRVREYQLKKAVTLQLFDAQGRVWLPAITLSKQRYFSYNDSQVLAKELEEQALYQALQRELLSAILVRLSVANERNLPQSALVAPP